MTFPPSLLLHTSHFPVERVVAVFPVIFARCHSICSSTVDVYGETTKDKDDLSLFQPGSKTRSYDVLYARQGRGHAGRRPIYSRMVEVPQPFHSPVSSNSPNRFPVPLRVLPQALPLYRTRVVDEGVGTSQPRTSCKLGRELSEGGGGGGPGQT